MIYDLASRRDKEITMEEGGHLRTKILTYLDNNLLNTIDDEGKLSV